MKRKIFSKLLMGALLVASVSSFTSCKDYDDDINSLKESVAKAALQSNLDALTTQVNGIKTTADQALTTANAAATKAELTAAKSEAMAKAAEGVANAATAQAAADAAKALAQEAKTAAESIDLSPYAKKTDVEAAAADAMTKIQTALADYWTAAKIQEELAKIQAQVDKALTEEDIEELTKKVDNAIEGVKAIWNAITNISLYKTDGGSIDNGYTINLVKGRVLKTKNHFTTQKVDATNLVGVNQAGDATFGKNDYFANAANSADKVVTFNDGEYFNFPSEIVVRVSPTSADLTTADLKFVDSQGNDISSVVEVKSVAPFTGILTRGGTPNGLWTVKLGLVGDKLLQDLYAVSKVDGNWTKADKAFAITVGNTQSSAADRKAVSEYNISFPNVYRYVGTHKMGNLYLGTHPTWRGGDVKVTTYSNRVKGGAGKAAGKEDDYNWKADAATSNVIQKSSARNVDPLQVENGQAIFLNFDNFAEPETSIAETDIYGRAITTKTLRPKYCYIIRDDKNAGQSDASEINAWNGYQYSGLNTLIDLDETPYPSFSVTIPAGSVKGDEVSFRVFAVNYDGTLADPDGINFNVFVGQDVNSYTASYTFTALKEVSQVLYVPFDGTQVKSNTTSKEVNTDAALGKTFAKWPTTDHVAADIKFGAGTGSSFATKDEWKDVKIAKITLNATTTLSEWNDNDNKTWGLALSSKDSYNTPDFRIFIDLTKALPTADDVKKLYSWKEGQLVGGVWKAVIYPETDVDKADAPVGHTLTTDPYTYATSAAPWNTANIKFGYKGMNNAINKLVKADGTDYTDKQFVFSFENAVYDYVNDKYGNTLFVPDFDSDNNVWSNRTPWTAGTWAAPTLVNTWKDNFVDGYIVNLIDKVKTEGDLTTAAQKKLKGLIDNNTEHASIIGYNFGRISSNPTNPWVNGDVNAGIDASGFDYIVVAEEFKTVFACPFHELNAEIIPFKNGKKANEDGDLKPIEQEWNYLYYNDAKIGKNMYSPTGTQTSYYSPANVTQQGVKITSKLGAELVVGTLENTLKHFASIKADKTTFTSNGTGNEDYFKAEAKTDGTITLTRISGTQDPKVDVPSTLTITGVCAFGHEHAIKIPFTVKTTAQ